MNVIVLTPTVSLRALASACGQESFNGDLPHLCVSAFGRFFLTAAPMDMEGGPGCLSFFTAAPMDSEGGPGRRIVMNALPDGVVKDMAVQG